MTTNQSPAPEGNTAPKSDWVDCPICGAPDMHRVPDDEYFLIECTNGCCGSNGGDNFDGLKDRARPSAAPPSEPLPTEGDKELAEQLRAQCWDWIEGRAEGEKGGWQWDNEWAARMIAQYRTERLKDVADLQQMWKQAQKEIQQGLDALGYGPTVNLLHACEDVVRERDEAKARCAAQVQEATAAKDRELADLRYNMGLLQAREKTVMGLAAHIEAKDARLLASEALVKQMREALEEADRELAELEDYAWPKTESDEFHGNAATPPVDIGAVRTSIAAALSATSFAPLQDGEWLNPDMKRLDWLTQNRGVLMESDVGKWYVTSPWRSFAVCNSPREAVDAAIAAKSLSAPDSTKVGKA